jgi:hypothetical protein
MKMTWESLQIFILRIHLLWIPTTKVLLLIIMSTPWQNRNKAMVGRTQIVLLVDARPAAIDPPMAAVLVVATRLVALCEVCLAQAVVVLLGHIQIQTRHMKHRYHSYISKHVFILDSFTLYNILIPPLRYVRKKRNWQKQKESVVTELSLWIERVDPATCVLLPLRELSTSGRRQRIITYITYMVSQIMDPR